MLSALILTSSTSIPLVQAADFRVGDRVGETVATDIKTYINGSEIPAYSTNGEALIRVADMANYGFDVWFEDGKAYVNSNNDKAFEPISRKAETGLPILYTDIEVELNGVTVPSYNINGNMAVPVERMVEIYEHHVLLPYNISYRWSGTERRLYIDVSTDRMVYRELMYSLLKAAKMDENSAFYKRYVRDCTDLNAVYADKISDLGDEYSFKNSLAMLVKADLIDINDYNGEPIRPRRACTITDAVFMAARILGCPSDAKAAMEYFAGKPNSFGFDRYFEQAKDYENCKINAADAADIAEWARPYFVYLMDLGVMKTDENNCLNPNGYLTSEKFNELKNAMLNYMEQGVVEKEIELSIYENLDDGKKLTQLPYKLKVPVQIIDNILYIPCYAIFDEAYNFELKNADIRAAKYAPTLTPVELFKQCESRIFVNHYAYGAHNYVYHVFPGLKAWLSFRCGFDLMRMWIVLGLSIRKACLSAGELVRYIQFTDFFTGSIEFRRYRWLFL